MVHKLHQLPYPYQVILGEPSSHASHHYTFTLTELLFAPFATSLLHKLEVRLVRPFPCCYAHYYSCEHNGLGCYKQISEIRSPQSEM